MAEAGDDNLEKMMAGRGAPTGSAAGASGGRRRSGGGVSWNSGLVTDQNTTRAIALENNGRSRG